MSRMRSRAILPVSFFSMTMGMSFSRFAP
jgi:hypothetical protein